MIASAIGGRVAEEFKFKKTTSGGSSDFEQATKIARNMVMRLGMSERLGTRMYGKREEAIFLGKEMSEQRDYSLKSEGLIDDEINRLLREGADNAKRIVTEHADKLDNLANYLLKHETAEASHFLAIMEGREPEIPKPAPAPAPEPQTPPTDPQAADKPQSSGNPEVALGVG